MRAERKLNLKFDSCAGVDDCQSWPVVPIIWLDPISKSRRGIRASVQRRRLVVVVKERGICGKCICSNLYPLLGMFDLMAVLSPVSKGVARGVWIRAFAWIHAFCLKLRNVRSAPWSLTMAAMPFFLDYMTILDAPSDTIIVNALPTLESERFEATRYSRHQRQTTHLPQTVIITVITWTTFTTTKTTSNHSGNSHNTPCLHHHL